MKELNYKQLVSNTKKHLKALYNVVFPNLCVVCSNDLHASEPGICSKCEQQLPITNFNLHDDNIVEETFWGRITIHRATALLYYRKGESAQKVLHAIKYKGNEKLANRMGELIGKSLLQTNWITSVDAIIPVPLHPSKQKSRGFNQSYRIAIGISKILNIPINDDIIYRYSHTSTQTRLNRYNRYKNMEGIFKTSTQTNLNGKHFLVIDDVLTSGSTIEACCTPLIMHSGVTVSIATLAYAAY